MAWFCAKTIGRETRAELYLERAGIDAFRPVIHRYFVDRRTQQERHRVLSLFPGYIFARIETDDERDLATSAIGVSYLLGNWTGDRFLPRQMPSQWIAHLIEAGPIIQGKKSTVKKGDRVKRVFGAISGLADIIGEVEKVDKSRFAVVKTTLFGAERRIKIAVDHLEAAE
jgi:transcription antitermination factor NusG